MSSGAGQPISPTLSPEVQEVMADWAKTLEAPGANPELLPMHGVGGDSRSRRRLERHLRARHAEELGWFYGWKRFLASHEAKPRSFVRIQSAFKGISIPSGVSLDGGSVEAHFRGSGPMAHAVSAVRWWPSSLNRINLAVEQRDLVSIGGEDRWRCAASSHLDPSAAICTWRADLASLRFDRGDYLEAARLYLENVSSRAEPIEALSCLVSCALSRDSRSEERLAREMTMQSIELGQAIEDYSMLIVESGTKPSLLTMARERAGRGVGEAAISAVLDTLEGQA